MQKTLLTVAAVAMMTIASVSADIIKREHPNEKALPIWSPYMMSNEQELQDRMENK